LFGDSESFLDDLSDNDLTTVNGGSFFFGLIVGLIITIVETNNIVEAPQYNTPDSFGNETTSFTGQGS
jgi:hypothetical protein